MGTLTGKLFAVCGVAVLAAAIFLAYMGDVRGAVAAGLIAVSAFLAGNRPGMPGAPSARHGWLILTLVACGMVILGFPLVIIGGALLALFVLQFAFNVRLARRFTSVALEPVGADAVMAGAEPLVQAFSSEGFRTIGGHRSRPAGKTITVTVMVSPDRNRVALVTEKVWEVASRFGTRWLLTINAGIAPLPTDVLRQEAGGGGPADVVRTHQAALELLEARALGPDRFATDAEALEATLQMERRALEFVGNASLMMSIRMETRGRPARRVLRDDEASRRQIDAWLGA